MLKICSPYIVVRCMRRPRVRGNQPYHTSGLQKQDQTHYQTLGLDQNASSGAIKRQYFLLSKAHHPDRNLDDPAASSRFMKISEAYSILSDEKKRSSYDGTLRVSRHFTESTSSVPRGSHSSSSTPYGARPASGLSRRRAHFKGPPPSFFRDGRSTKRSTGPGSFQRANAEGAEGGMGYGQGFQGVDVPHFDRERHFRTQMNQEERMRRRKTLEDEYDASGGAADVFGRFLLVGGIVALAFVPVMLANRD